MDSKLFENIQSEFLNNIMVRITKQNLKKPLKQF